MSDSWAREIVETFQETGSRDKKSYEKGNLDDRIKRFSPLAGSAFVENASIFLQLSEISL